MNELTLNCWVVTTKVPKSTWITSRRALRLSLQSVPPLKVHKAIMTQLVKQWNTARVIWQLKDWKSLKDYLLSVISQQVYTPQLVIMKARFVSPKEQRVASLLLLLVLLVDQEPQLQLALDLMVLLRYTDILVMDVVLIFA